MGSLSSALVGAAMDRQDGDSGIKGAIIGTIAEKAIRVMVPVIATYALGRAVEYGIRRAMRAATGYDPVVTGAGGARARAV